MILSTKGRYAVMAMVELALRTNERPIALAEIAGAQEIPLAYLEQLFARMKKAELVQSVRGPGGGYSLAQDAAGIPIADIIIASDESLKMTRCTPGEAGCMAPKTRCLTHDLWEGLGNHIEHYLGAITLADVVQGNVAQKTSLLQKNTFTETYIHADALC